MSTARRQMLVVAPAVFAAALTIMLALQARQAVRALRAPVTGAVDMLLSAPLYTAYTKEGRTVRVWAPEGTPDGFPPKVITLLRPEAEIGAKASITHVAADLGRYVVAEHAVYMIGNVRLTRSDGTTLNAERARIDIERGTAVAEGSVRLQIKERKKS